GRLPEVTTSTLDEVARFISSVQNRDYLAFQAYLPYDESVEHAIQELRMAARDRWRVATTVGFGPRYLHSTGQFHKGGPNTGVFLQVVDDTGDERPIPGKAFGVGRPNRAQAAGDYESLKERGRRVARMII